VIVLPMAALAEVGPWNGRMHSRTSNPLPLGPRFPEVVQRPRDQIGFIEGHKGKARDDIGETIALSL